MQALISAATFLSLLVFLRARAGDEKLTQEQVTNLLRGELERSRQANDDQARGLRQEIGDNLRGLQETALKGFGESFSRVVEQLERVYKGIGEMQALAAGVGDLKKV